MVHGRSMKLAQSSNNYDYITMVTKPPRPPCWRDFVSENRQKQEKDASPLPFSDLSQVARKATRSTEQLMLFGLSSASPSVVTNAQTNQTSTTHGRSNSVKSQKKQRGKLHRTRSELTIDEEDIPEDRTMTLAQTKPSEFGLRRTQWDPHVYIEDNARRCQRWLEQVRASRPLEDVHFAQGAGIEVEVPDEECLVSGHSSEPDLDSVSIVSVDYLRETQSLPRPSRSRSRHKSRKSPISTTQIHIDSIEENPQVVASQPDCNHGDGGATCDVTKSVNVGLDKRAPLDLYKQTVQTEISKEKRISQPGDACQLATSGESKISQSSR